MGVEAEVQDNARVPWSMPSWPVTFLLSTGQEDGLDPSGQIQTFTSSNQIRPAAGWETRTPSQADIQVLGKAEITSLLTFGKMLIEQPPRDDRDGVIIDDAGRFSQPLDIRREKRHRQHPAARARILYARRSKQCVHFTSVTSLAAERRSSHGCWEVARPKASPWHFDLGPGRFSLMRATIHG